MRRLFPAIWVEGRKQEEEAPGDMQWQEAGTPQGWQGGHKKRGLQSPAGAEGKVWGAKALEEQLPPKKQP